MSKENLGLTMGHRQEYLYNSNNEKAQSKWWAQPEGEMHKHIWPLCERIEANQGLRSANNLKFAKLYSNMRMLSLRDGKFGTVTNFENFLENNLTYNVTKSCIDSSTAKVSKNKPRPVYITEGGNWLLQQKAKRLNQFVLGAFQSIGDGMDIDRTMWGLGTQCFRDSGIFGTGGTYFYTEGNSVKAERVISDELLIDDIEGMYRKPRQIHRQRYVFREILLDLYPKHAFKILQAPNPLLGTSGSSGTVADMVKVIESWHLPSGENAKDGMRVVSIENCDLWAKPYEDDFFPFLFQRWSVRPLGFFGQGLAEELIPIQLEINKVLRKIAISQDLVCVPSIWLDHMSRSLAKNINNRIGGIRYYSGRPPIETTGKGLGPEVYNYLETLYMRAFETTGISQLSATSQKPAGLDAAVALREYKDTETERFAVQQENYEMYYVEAAELVKKMSRRLAKEGKDPIVNFKDGMSLKTLNFSDVDIPDSKTMCAPSPSRMLPKEPAGRLAYVQELIQAGIYDQEEGLELLDFPDTAKTNRIKLSDRMDAIKTIETMIEKNIYYPPEPYMNLELCMKMAKSYYLNGRTDDMPEERLELLRDFMSDCELLIDQRGRAQQELEAERAEMEAIEMQQEQEAMQPQEQMPEQVVQEEVLPPEAIDMQPAV